MGSINSVGILVAIRDWCASRSIVSVILIGFFVISDIANFTLKIVGLGLVAFIFGTIAGVLFGKLLCKATHGKVNPLMRPRRFR